MLSAWINPTILSFVLRVYVRGCMRECLQMNAGAQRGQKRERDPLKLELRGGCELSDVSAGIQTPVLGQCALLTSAISQAPVSCC